ncbi:MAG TPA: hypothetical protein VF837_00540 [Patescibacteria group bacterium]
MTGKYLPVDDLTMEMAEVILKIFAIIDKKLEGHSYGDHVYVNYKEFGNLLDDKPQSYIRRVNREIYKRYHGRRLTVVIRTDPQNGSVLDLN